MKDTIKIKRALEAAERDLETLQRNIRKSLAYPDYALASLADVSKAIATLSADAEQQEKAQPNVDWAGLALDLERQAKRVESKTVERAMLAAAHGLRLIGAPVETVQPASKPEFKHPDDAAVDRFAIAMKDKLAKARAKGRSGWDNEALCTVEYLSELLREHVEKGDPVDVANFCMMLQQRGSRIVGSTKSSDAQPAPSAALTDEEIRIIYATEIGISAKSDDVAFARAVLAAALTRCATSKEASAPARDVREAPPCWWIDFGRYGQITMRKAGADAAMAEGAKVVRYSVEAAPARDDVLPPMPSLPSHVEPCSMEFIEWALKVRDIAIRALRTQPAQQATTAEPSVQEAGKVGGQSICYDSRFMEALNSYMDAVTSEPRNTDRRINLRLEIFAAADAWKATTAEPSVPVQAVTDEEILMFICDNTGKRINLPNFTLEELIAFARKFERRLLSGSAKPSEDQIMAAAQQVERIRDFIAVGPVQKAALVDFVSVLAGSAKGEVNG